MLVTQVWTPRTGGVASYIYRTVWHCDRSAPWPHSQLPSRRSEVAGSVRGKWLGTRKRNQILIHSWFILPDRWDLLSRPESTSSLAAVWSFYWMMERQAARSLLQSELQQWQALALGVLAFHSGPKRTDICLQYFQQGAWFPACSLLSSYADIEW